MNIAVIPRYARDDDEHCCTMLQQVGWAVKPSIVELILSSVHHETPTVSSLNKCLSIGLKERNILALLHTGA
ncbi:hypothetical protein Lste_0973 [Legionella steelei]|uniref:Uncharacterized protein n=1 Tax=Legionella steelei TaxID=947033 RepID=A0A0W0ZFL5_9GAMM|nr:hypothetical protein Lste_0973 [Legionella steelei]OJW06645.1 MAG: hypothetical protein BGO44_17795 [Legionella sp. 39-23]